MEARLTIFGDWVIEFVRESNRIAGIVREPSQREIGAHRGLLSAATLRRGNLEMFVKHIEPDARLREESSPSRIDRLLSMLCTQPMSGAQLAQLFAGLRPFTDGNGRCSRALWLWHKLHRPEEDSEPRGPALAAQAGANDTSGRPEP